MSSEIQLEEPVSLRSLRAAGEALSGLEGVARAFADSPEMREALNTHHQELFLETAAFVHNNPELREYYAATVSSCKASGIAEQILEEDDGYFEASLFMELFYPEEGIIIDSSDPEPEQLQEPDTIKALYINGKLFTQDEAVALLTKLLHQAGGPIKPAKLREQGLERFVYGSTTSQVTSKMVSLRKRLRKHLVNFFGTDEMFIEDGNTKARTYELRLGGVTLLESIEVTPIPEQEQIPAPKAASANAAIQTVDTGLYEQDVAANTNDQPPLKADCKLWIRGSEYSFSQLERKIIDAILAGNNSVSAIIGHLQNGSRKAEPEFFRDEFLPALNNLSSFAVNGEKIITLSYEEFDGRRVKQYHLPQNARIEDYPRQQRQVLRFLDPSKPKEQSSSQPPDTQAMIPITSTEPSRSPRRRKLAPHTETDKQPPLPREEIVPVIYGEKRLRREDETVIELELSERRLFEILLELGDRKRSTIQELVKALGYEKADATASSIVADDLTKLQAKVGKGIVRRKQKSGQPARWWLNMDYVQKAIES